MIQNTNIIKFNNKVFKPTDTSNILLSSLKNLKLKGKILDLGCGSGYIAIGVLNFKNKKIEMYGSDISEEACKLTEKNAKFNGYKINVKKGSLYQPWKNFKFNFIINDVSGISEVLAKKTKWFKNVSCESGEDGTKLTLNVLKNSKKYLLKNGAIIFPVLSLANEEKIFDYLKNNFKNYKILATQDWVMPKELMKYSKILEKLKKKNFISFEKKFGLYVWNTKIIYAKN
jgi:methylase of polypeptide subunit release factors